MAGADYYSCDKCGCKTFYDANVYYVFEPDDEDYAENPATKGLWPAGNVGLMVVLCRSCTADLGGFDALWKALGVKD